MDRDTFWKIINEVNSETDHNDQEAVLNATEEKLIQYTLNEIIDWHNIKSIYMNLADRNDLWAACAATHSHSTDDGFIDFRAWLISQGKEIYMSALNNPDSLAGFDIPKGSAGFESYGYVADYAYAKKIKSERQMKDTFLARKYSIYDVINIRPLCKDVVDEIMTEIVHRPDIKSDWDWSDLPQAVPRLYEKYDNVPEEGEDMDFKLE